MPLHGKIVVIKRSGGDGTEFPLTATCLFGRKPDCDIRIQLPQVSKEHCRIDLNENKEVILTNLSSVNPTRVNGDVLQQAERLKHGDVITIIDRSFRFEYPPAPTPKKRSSIGSKTEKFKVLQDQQAGDTVTTETKENRISEVSTDPHLKDGTNHDNIQRSLENAVEVESKKDDDLLQTKTTSPFNDLYQMIKQSLDVKTPRKSSASLLQTPASRFCTPKPVSVKKNGGNPVISTEDKSTQKKNEANVNSGAAETKRKVEMNEIPMSVKKQRSSFQASSTEMARPEAENAVKTEATSPQKKERATPQRFTVCEVIEQVCPQTTKSPLRRRSKEATPGKPAAPKEQEKQAMTRSVKESPSNSGKAEKVKQMSKKRKSGELAADLTTQQMKTKRVSFGGQLSPELFDKRLPPDSPLRRGGTPRRSFCLLKTRQSLLRRASAIGLMQQHPDSPNVRSPAKKRTPSPKKSSSAKNASPKTPSSARNSPKSRPSSPKTPVPAKKSPKSSSPSPKTATPGKKSPVSKKLSPKAVTPGEKLTKARTPSPKTVTPGKKSPKSRSPSPKTVTPGEKLTKARTPSPKTVTPGKKSPKSRSPSPKAVTPRKKTPKPRTPAPRAASPATRSSESKSPTRGRPPSRNKAEVQPTPGDQTPTPRGRFSVSLIRTPSPIVEHAVTDQVPLVTATPKIPLRRKSMKSTSRKTPSVRKSAVKTMCRRSGISRASMKALSSWANIVKFGQAKPQMAAPVKKVVPKKMRKKAVPKPQTPARKLKDHASTGHVDSPITIVVGRAHQQKVVHSTGAAPRLVTNTAFLKKSMKIDEDLAGISEMFKTPVNERKRRSVVNDNSAMKTPLGGLGTSVIDPSVLNTPEEPGEMTVSPLSVSSTVKDKSYNSEAVQRLLDEDQESSFLCDIPPAVETISDSSEEQCTDLKTISATTPKQMPDCLTGVRRIMKTPRQKAEPVEDLRGKLLKTPKQKLEQQECLTGVKRIMKTPRQKAEPVEDLRGKLLKTPKQKLEQQECLTGVKRIFETPQQEAEPLQDLQGKLIETPGALEADDVSRDGAEEMTETSTCMQESEGVAEMTDTTDSDMKSSPSVCLTGIKRLMKTPKDRNAPVEDLLGVKRPMEISREKVEPVEDNFGIERLLKSPRLRNNPVEDFEGLKELMEEPLADPPGQLETNEAYDQTPVDCGGDVAKELEFTLEEPQDDVPSDGIDNVHHVDVGKQADANEVDGDDHLEEGPSGHENVESSDAMETISQAAVDENLPVEDTKVETAEVELSDEPKVDTVDETVSEEQPKMETAAGKVTEIETAADPDQVTEIETAADPELVAEIETAADPDQVTEIETAADPDQVTEIETAADPDQVTEIETAADPDQVAEIETAADPDHEKTSTRSRRGKMLESASAENNQEAQVYSEDPVVSAPVRARRGRKNEATAQPAVRQTSRRRNAKTAESSGVELSAEENVSLVSNVARKPTRGRNAKKASDDKVEAVMAQDISSEKMPESENDQRTPADVNHKENDSAALPEKPKRGRKTNRPEKSVPEQQDMPCAPSDVVPQADMAKEVDANKVSSGQMKVSSTGSDENEPDAMKTVPQVPATEILPEVETATCKVTEMEAAVVPKKSVQGRKAKVVQSKSSEDKEEVREHSEDPAVPAPVRGRRGKKAEATALPAVRQTRSKNVKSQESSSNYQSEMVAENAVETTQVTEIITEAVNDQTPPVTTHQEENISAPHAKETSMKPKRGRKTKTPVEPEKREVVSDEHPLTDAPPQKSIPSLGKPRRGRKAVLDTVEQSEAAEETVLTVEPKQQPQPPVRARRGRNAKVEEVKLEINDRTTSVEISKSIEQVKTSRRTRKAEQDHVEPKEIQTVESAVPQEAEVLPVEPVANEQAVTATRTTRGRKSKQDAGSKSLVKSTEVQEVPAASSTDKPKRGRRGKLVSDEVPAVIPEEKATLELESQEKSNEVDPPVIKSSRAKGLKNEVSLAIPAKRARRGAAPSHEETDAESTVLISGKRGRRTAAKSVKENDMVSCDQVNPTEDLSNAVKEDAQKSVKWKKDIKVFEMLTVTPKAVRGRKSKLGDRVDAESQIVSKNVSKTEEKHLSDTVAEALPVKRARRGLKVVAETSDKAESTSSVKSVEAETQPKTRRGRSAKK